MQYFIVQHPNIWFHSCLGKHVVYVLPYFCEGWCLSVPNRMAYDAIGIIMIPYQYIFVSAGLFYWETSSEFLIGCHHLITVDEHVRSLLIFLIWLRLWWEDIQFIGVAFFICSSFVRHFGALKILPLLV